MKSTSQSKNNFQKKYNRKGKMSATRTVNASQRISPYASFRMSCKGSTIISKCESMQNFKKGQNINSSLKKSDKQFKDYRNAHKFSVHPNFNSCTYTPKNFQTQADEEMLTVNRSNFKFMYQIGFGGFGKVWKVQEKKSWEYYAMKEIHKRKVIEKDSIDCIMNQRKVLSTLNHPFLVNIKWAFQDKSCLYLIMDYLKGADLRYHICYRQKFSETQTKFILACLIIAIEEIQSKGIVHRDIKPQNLVLQQSGYVRLTDFGIAKYARDLKTGKYDSSGTPGYMAPQVLFKQNYNQTSDFFAVGVIGYELMLGKRPYFGKNRKQIKQKIQLQEIMISESQRPQSWSKQSADFINQLLKINPNQRLGSEQGTKQLKEHSWMSDMNWKKLYKKQLIPPFIPNIICQTKDYLQQIQSYNQMNSEQNSKNFLLVTNEQNKLFDGYQLSLTSPYATPFRNIRNTLQKTMAQKQGQRQRQQSKQPKNMKQKYKQAQNFNKLQNKSRKMLRIN